MADYISRKAAINTQERRCLGCPVDRRLCYKCAVTTTTKQLLELPAADVRPVVRGKWECADDEEFSQPHVHCSNCGEYCFAWYRRFSYCPNCGADMRGNND